MAREWIDERHYKILHNDYDDQGKLVGQHYEYYTENETKDTIYITHKWCEDLKKAQSNGTSVSDFSKFEKKVVYENGNTVVPIKKMEIKYGTKETIYTFTKLDGSTFNVEFVWA